MNTNREPQHSEIAAKQAPRIVIIGGGPAGLMAAEWLSKAGLSVAVYDAMRSVGRKFLLAGKGGLNITHSEAFEPFLERYGDRRAQIKPWLEAFGPDELRAWVHELGIDTFVGSSGRVFPSEMKAAPLLRAWLQRLRASGVAFYMQHRWLGWYDDGSLRFATPNGELAVEADAVLLALGGGSWPKLGSDGSWVNILQRQGVAVHALQSANCGFDAAWSEYFRERFAGEPVKTAVLTFNTFQRRGEFVITKTGIEGSLIYAVSSFLRDEITNKGSATIWLDLAPDKSESQLAARLSKPRGSRSMSSHLRSRVNLKGVKAGLLRELAPPEAFDEPARLATAIKAVPITVTVPRPLAEVISSAGGVSFAAVDNSLMVRALPGLFCAGEMLDWEAPTGGYLLTACFASGRFAAQGVLDWLDKRP